jgi:UDP-N-acetylmuramoylalanine--D-glutamate ligase
MTDNLQGKRVTVMGLGLHGGAVGTVQWLASLGAKITVTDLKSEEELAPSLEKLRDFQDVTYVFGEHRDSDFTDADLIVRNPSVPSSSEYLAKAKEAGVPVEMDSSLFFLHCPSEDIIGVTGSKGKTTTAKAITAVLKAGSVDVVEVGTDGVSPLGKLSDITADTTVVFELSSWRLEALAAHELSPHTAVVTNIYREHLNTYESFQDYIEAKKAIVRYQTEDDVAILNEDDNELRSWGENLVSTVHWYSTKDAPPNTKLIGNLQRQNLVPAMIIGSLRGLDEGVVHSSIASIDPLPHRLELVRELDDVRYINDSAATMPDATIAALDALGDESIVLILGGSDKKLEFDALAKKIASLNIKALIWLPGTATERMQQAVQAESSAQSVDVATMQEAVVEARKLVEENDVVLLSPGATSFGLFKHEFDRGDQFRSAVQSLN